jgi:DNA polymerase-1
MMVVSDYPSKDDDKYGLVLGDNPLFWKVVEEVVGIDKKLLYTTTLVKCRPYQGKPSLKEAYKCVHYLKEEIKKVKPKVILTMGDLCLQAIIGEQGIVKNRGKVFDVVFDLGEGPSAVKVVPTYSTGYVLNAGNELPNFATDIQKAYHIYSGIEQTGRSTDIVTVDTWDKVDDLIRYVKYTKDFCYDFETFSKDDSDKKAPLDPYCENFDVSVLSMSFQHHSSYVLPVHHPESPWSQDDLDIILDRIYEELLLDSEIDKIAHNMKFDLHCWAWLGYTGFKGRQYDTMTMHHTLDENSPHGLKDITSLIFPEYTDYEKEIKQYGGWGKIPLDKLGLYAGTDTDLTIRLKTHFLEKLLAIPRLYRLYRNLMCSSIIPLWEAEYEGCYVDTGFASRAIKEAEGILVTQEKRLRRFSQVVKFEQAKNYEARVAAINEAKEKLQKAKDRESDSRATKFQKEKDKLAEAIARDKRNAAYEGRIKERLEALSKPGITAAIKQAQEKLQNLTIGTVQVYEGINFNSSNQLKELLYGTNGFNKPLPYVRGKGHIETTDKKYLEQLNDSSGFIDALLLYRTIQKMLSTYLVGIYERTDRHKRLHSSFLQHGTVTGRLSSRNPNMQNIPRGAKLKDEAAIKVVGQIKGLFVPPTEDHTIVQVDYSQGELRVAAEFGREEVMLKAYNDGADIHALTARNVAGLSEEAWNDLEKGDQKTMRSNAKAVNFGFIYGLGVDGFMEYAKNNYGVEYSKDEATRIRENYFKTYPRLLLWHQDYIQRAELHGYVETLFGRRRRLPDILHPDDNKKAKAERDAVNSPIQGTLGEVTVFAIAILRHRLDPRVRLMNTVHDSIIYYVPDDLLDSTLRLIKDTCENLPMKKYFGREFKRVTMKVDIETSKTSWSKLEEYSFE